ncbi:hypothetical protein TNCV_3830841 [Trichonephila clavipes]|nr:hypothetical protein TNCV_3830841 [Trichonephila clavipes]
MGKEKKELRTVPVGDSRAFWNEDFRYLRSDSLREVGGLASPPLKSFGHFSRLGTGISSIGSRKDLKFIPTGGWGWHGGMMYDISSVREESCLFQPPKS